jgi:hypothetical protein
MVLLPNMNEGQVLYFYNNLIKLTRASGVGSLYKSEEPASSKNI